MFNCRISAVQPAWGFSGLLYDFSAMLSIERPLVPKVVIGGGIIGLCAAWYLNESGYEVIVLERTAVGAESSWAGGGILSALYPSRYLALAPLVADSVLEYHRIAAKVLDESGLDPELEPCLLLVLDAAEINDVTDSNGSILLSEKELSAMEPKLRSPCGRAKAYPIAHIRNPRFTRAMKTALSRRGVRFIEHQEVLGFNSKRGQLVSLSGAFGVIPAADCVLATGAWTGDLLSSTGVSLPIRPVRGQMIAIQTAPEVISNVIVHEYRYLIPRRDGLVLIGSTIEHVGFTKETTEAAKAELFAKAVQLVPQLSGNTIRYHWAGLRPGSPDDAPFIGEHPEIKGLFVCAGHYRNGFATGPASARLVVDMMLGRPPSVDPTPFRLDRPCPDWKI